MLHEGSRMELNPEIIYDYDWMQKNTAIGLEKSKWTNAKNLPSLTVTQYLEGT